MRESETGDPVSWLLIHRGWKVVSSEGEAIGRVHEVVGDHAHDIFDGLAVSRSALGRTRYVPSELVGEITESVVRLTVTRADAAGLGQYVRRR